MKDAPIKCKIEETDDETGTQIIVEKIIEQVNVKEVIKRISKHMPLSPDFEVFVDGVRVKPFKLSTRRNWKFSEKLPNVGEVEFELFYSNHLLERDERGIYVKVNNRTVNPEQGDWLRIGKEFRGNSFETKFFGLVKADGLDDNIMVNRAGFNSDIKIKEVETWLKRNIRTVMGEILSEQEAKKIEEAANELANTIPQLQRIVKNSNILPDWSKFRMRSSKLKEMNGKLVDAKRKQSQRTKGFGTAVEPKRSFQQIIKSLQEGGKGTIRVGEKTIAFKLDSLTDDGPESHIDIENSVMYYNQDHPQFLLALKENCLAYHFRKTFCFEYAKIATNTIEEFLEAFDNMIRTETNLDNR